MIFRQIKYQIVTRISGAKQKKAQGLIGGNKTNAAGNGGKSET